jgi:hypothetical protein
MIKDKITDKHGGDNKNNVYSKIKKRKEHYITYYMRYTKLSGLGYKLSSLKL